ncbi:MULTISPECIES: hypothetical protein [Pseudoalteromonas]|uniref:Uncharacterized protein n=1 Tax=Pseudoalteromonas rubra TaxID=43658 RepID=A0A5S3UUM4_9GAMM|nr:MULTISPECIES: hypothetical protein [Pseudoalteromonas]MCG7563265.1 hypothetical protein [Pseudoalteromonas sp. McH1-42]MEC4090379.1 hypothetical protein [Pseudoalteromonas rubra]QPB84375.1 hypothetical protein CWC22_015825 [Pseudoalteromonas rubra]
MKKLITAACTLLLSGQVYAGAQTSLGQIQTIYVNNSWTMVHGSSITGNPDGCSNPEYYAIVPSHPNYNAMHATLLAAKFAGKKVRFWVSGCSGQNNRHPRIHSIWVY